MQLRRFLLFRFLFQRVVDECFLAPIPKQDTAPELPRPQQLCDGSSIERIIDKLGDRWISLRLHPKYQ